MNRRNHRGFLSRQLSGFASKSNRRSSRGGSRSRTLSVESLEARQVLTAIPLAGGGYLGDDGSISFRSVQDFADAYIPDDLPAYDPSNGALQLVASIPDIDKIRIYETDNVDAANSTNADDLQVGGSSGLDLTGAGVTVGVWDGGAVRGSHQEFSGNVSVEEQVPIDDHATHVAGTIAASGTNPLAQGMASGVDILSWDFINDAAEIGANASRVDVSNHSYGLVTGWSQPVAYATPSGGIDFWRGDYFISQTEDSNFGKYGSTARQLDLTLNANPHLLSVHSSGNDHGDAFSDFSTVGAYLAFLSGDPGFPGYAGTGLYVLDSSVYPAPLPDGEGADGFDTLSPTKSAKNSIVIGAAEDAIDDPKDSTTLQITSFSSSGSTDDGRIKPDLVANGSNLLSSVSTADDDYDIYSGTSMATPNATGSIALLLEHYNNLFNDQPSADVIKNALIHTATDAGRAGPDYVYGWGYVDALAAANFLTNAAGSIGGDRILDGSYTGTELSFPLISEGVNPITASIVWNDPAAQPDSASTLDDRTSRLIHDLDIWIVSPNGQVHRPWTLDPANPTTAAVQTAANHRDNVEQVVISAPIEGVYTLYVGHTGSVASQDFSLLASGVDTAAVQGVKYQDINGNGMQDTGELGLAGWTIYADDNDNGRLDAGEESAVTNGQGQYVLSLAPGDYAIREVMQDKWTQTAPGGDGAHRITVPGGGVAITGIDFGNRADPGSISGFVWSDRNQNATRESNESGLANITLFIDSDGDGALTTGEPVAVTNSAGTYQFSEVPVGTHTVLQVLRAGMTQTFPAGGGGHTVTIAPAQAVTNLNFGNYFQPATIAGFVWHDTNPDGLRESGERGMGNVFVYLDNDNDGTLSLSEPSVRTNSIGRYEFVVPPGEYNIRVASTAGFAQTFPEDNGSQFVVALPNDLLVGNDFGLRGYVADYGDAPSPYPTRFSSAGASHEYVAGFSLGSVVSPDLNGQPSANAQGDDDDGVQFLTSIEAGEQATVQAVASGEGYLSFWIDFDRDGVWAADELVVSDELIGTTSSQFTFDVPTDTEPGTSYARFRFSTQQGLAPTGPAVDGEVEDWPVTLINNIPVDDEDDDSGDSGTDGGDGGTPVTHSHTNSARRNDVNADGKVDLTDALFVVGSIRESGPYGLTAPTTAPGLYLDTNSDMRVNLSDALNIVLEIRAIRLANEQAATASLSSEGERESNGSLAGSSSKSSLGAGEGESEADNHDQALLAESAVQSVGASLGVSAAEELDDETVDLIASDIAAEA